MGDDSGCCGRFIFCPLPSLFIFTQTAANFCASNIPYLFLINCVLKKSLLQIVFWGLEDGIPGNLFLLLCLMYIKKNLNMHYVFSCILADFHLNLEFMHSCPFMRGAGTLYGITQFVLHLVGFYAIELDCCLPLEPMKNLELGFPAQQCPFHCHGYKKKWKGKFAATVAASKHEKGAYVILQLPQIFLLCRC